MPEKRVVDRLQLLKLVPAAREAFEAEKLSLRTAFMVACMPEPLQAEATQHLANWGGEPMGPKAARAFIRERYMLRLAQAPFDPADAALKPDAGSCEACPKRTGASPQLFDDIADGDTCTDPSCFAAKRMLHREQQVAQLRGEGYTVMQGEAAEEACSADGRALKPGLHALEEMVPFHLGDNTLKVLDVMERAKAPAEDTRVVDHPSSPTLHFAVSTARLEAALRKIKAHRTQIDAKKPAAPAPAPAAAANDQAQDANP